MQLKDLPREEILDACRAFHAGTADTPDVALASKYPVKLIMRRMEQMVNEGLLEYGVSLRTAWPVTPPPQTSSDATARPG